jgi:hypothetical protein
VIETLSALPAGFFFVRRKWFDFRGESNGALVKAAHTWRCHHRYGATNVPPDFSHHEKLFAKVKRLPRAQRRPVPF